MLTWADRRRCGREGLEEAVALGHAASLFPDHVLGTLLGFPGTPGGSLGSAVPSAQGHPSPRLRTPEAQGRCDVLGAGRDFTNVRLEPRAEAGALPRLPCPCAHSATSFQQASASWGNMRLCLIKVRPGVTTFRQAGEVGERHTACPW